MRFLSCFSLDAKSSVSAHTCPIPHYIAADLFCRFKCFFSNTRSIHCYSLYGQSLCGEWKKVCKNNDERFNQFQWLTFFSTVIQLIIISIPPLSEDMIAGQYIVLWQIPSSCKRARSTHIPIYHDDMI